MNHIVEEVKYKPNDRLEVKKKPLVIKWKDAEMIRSHSLLSAVEEIINKAETLDVCKINIIGEPATGKTTLADTLGHLIHKKAKIPFAVRSFGKEEFKDIDATLDNLEPVNYVLKFGDLSFLKADFTNKQIDTIKQRITTIRHRQADVKMILIYDYHYSLGLDKYLRQSDFKLFTSIGSEETENVLAQIGIRYQKLIYKFKKWFHQETTGNHQVTINLSREKKNPHPFIYKYKDPFVLSLFWNGNTCRPVIFPKRHWIDRLCPTCSIQENLPPDLSLDDYISEANSKYGIQTIETAVKLLARDNGIDVFSHSVKQATKYIRDSMKLRQIPLHTLISYMNLDPSDSPRRQKFDGVLLAEPIDTSFK